MSDNTRDVQRLRQLIREAVDPLHEGDVAYTPEGVAIAVTAALAATGLRPLPEGHVWMDGKEWRVMPLPRNGVHGLSCRWLEPIDNEGETRDG